MVLSSYTQDSGAAVITVHRGVGSPRKQRTSLVRETQKVDVKTNLLLRGKYCLLYNNAISPSVSSATPSLCFGAELSCFNSCLWKTCYITFSSCHYIFSSHLPHLSTMPPRISRRWARSAEMSVGASASQIQGTNSIFVDQ